MVEQILTRELYSEFRLESGWMLRNVAIQKFGTEIVVDASVDRASPDTTAFQLVFKDCRYTTWDVSAEEYQESDGYDVVGFDLYDNAEGKEAVISTDSFEVMITYGELLIHYE